MARRTERHQAVEIEGRAPLGALDDVVEFEGAPAATGLALPAGRTKTQRGPSRSDELLLNAIRVPRPYLYVSSGNRIRASEEYRSYSFNRLSGTSEICLTSGERGLMIPLPSPSRNELNPCLGRHRW